MSKEITETERRAIIIKETADEYRIAWDRIDYIKDEQARARAANMILMGAAKRTLPSDLGFSRGGKTTEKKSSEKAYNENSEIWVECPKCGSTQICHESQRGRKYQACFDCGMFLQRDGQTKEMGSAQ